MYIKVGDIVAVIAGKDRFFIDKDGIKKNKIGKVLKIFFKEQKVLVEGVNIITKHQKPLNKEDKGGILKQEVPIHISNVALIDPDKKIPTRVGFRIESNKKIRYSKKTGNVLDNFESK
ncbi:MAG: 50S ribosomal protein L24 [Candidatus Phytoplasma cynodontis]|uniref:50S ribosomal protein L24 n=1 Tax='Cynodon dactylon' phytoplasma TaxID=295320 RepID=UPI001265C38D|nr:50S ribosomal protein L24 ['Cynodon dactylon' phytoplasma]KAB8121976.1 50S ribosomal protein L24 ['Cynodon dactylon' phytoplasma]WIA07610.1 MAG: 50S ribosomal protein L24 [Candidatus Phytoplasma cynodontis]